MSRDTRPTFSLIVGTAGHIDHGKTALVRALTGRDTDRLPEEKRRGITIELGFAEMILEEVKFGIVDVPGHERFVRQMLAGATGMDLAMLIVAADESVKPQTREHLDVLRYLDLRGGVVVLTKCDLVDEDWIGLVEEEIRELIRGTKLEQSPFVRTSATTGLGIPELKRVLLTQARQLALDSSAKKLPFRIPIDRVFSLPGHGTVITGSVASGSVQVGDALVIQPLGLETRVRQIQSHDRFVNAVGRGERAALNLGGVHPDQLVRGHELASPGYLQPAKRLLTTIQLVATASAPLRHRSRVRLHVGTAEIAATVDTLGNGEIHPGDSQVIQLTLAEAVATTWGQPIVIRRESPAATIGGGRILVPDAPRLRKLSSDEANLVSQLSQGDEAARAAAAVYFSAHRSWSPKDLHRLAGILNGEDICHQLLQQKVLIPFDLGPQKSVYFHRGIVENWESRLCAYLEAFHEKNPLATLVDRSTLVQAFAYLGDANIVQRVLENMARVGKVRLTDRGVGLKDRQPKLSANQRLTLRSMIDALKAARVQPPLADDFRKTFPVHAKDIDKLLEIAVSDNEVVKIAKGFYLHREVESEIRNSLAAAFKARPALTVSDIREILGTTRKYAVPLCEYFDDVKFTIRHGDQRQLRLES